MKNLRIYGKPPYTTAVVHGGPGAMGEMAPVARTLSSDLGILEPLQTATSVAGQIDELQGVLEAHGDGPITLIGHSWGAWLSFMVAAQHPDRIKKLILVSSGPFEEQYVPTMRQRQADRLSEEESKTMNTLAAALNDPANEDRDAVLGQLGTLMQKVNSFDPLNPMPEDTDMVAPRADIFQSIWPEAAARRRDGVLLELGKQVECPVVAIHGDYDSHPAEGVEKPLMATLADFRFILLKKCGHTPWLERQARDPFYDILRREL